MTITEYYQIKSDVERELNNPDFGRYVGSPMTIQEAKNNLADTSVACFVLRGSVTYVILAESTKYP